MLDVYCCISTQTYSSHVYSERCWRPAVIAAGRKAATIQTAGAASRAAECIDFEESASVSDFPLVNSVLSSHSHLPTA